MGSDARTLTESNAEELADWCGGRVVREHNALDHDSWTPGINVPIKHGVQRASVGDSIVRKNDGTFEVFNTLFKLIGE
jgi:hypothetical protein